MSDTAPTKLYTALLAAQRAMGHVKKDAKNPAFRSSYATLQSVMDTIEGPLWENGLLVVQRFQYDRIGHGDGAGEGTPILITQIVHAATGDAVESVVAVACKDPHDPQKVGSAITYYRRYSLLSLLGLTTEDDDGNAASQPRPQQRPVQATSGPQANGSPQTHAYRDIPPQPPYAPRQAVREELAARADAAPAALTEAEFVAFFREQERQFLNGTERPYIQANIKAQRARFGAHQYARSLDWWKAFVEADEPGMAAALGQPAPVEVR